MNISRKKIGDKGESIAASWLQKNGFEILERNYYSPFGEIDIIASKAAVLHFVEVKTRLSSTFGTPLESITKKKYSRIQKTVYTYLEEKGFAYHDFQIDLVGIQKKSNGKLLLTYMPCLI